MEKLPNELLAKVASDLDTESLRSLALVSKQMELISQGHLWRNIRIPDRRQSATNSDIAELARVLIEKPCLGKIIRNLELHPEDRMVAVETSQVSPQKFRLSHSVRLEVNECALVALILERTPNLEVLKLEVLADAQSYRHEYDDQRYTDAKSPVELSFGLRRDGAAEAARHAFRPEGLVKLKELHLNAKVFEWSWCELPSLRVLHIGRGCCLEDCGLPDDVTSSISTVTWDMCALEMETEHPEKNSEFLSRFSSLKELNIWFSNSKVTQVDQDLHPEYEPVFEGGLYDDNDLNYPLHRFVNGQLSGLTNTLEGLTLGLSEKDCENQLYAGVVDRSDFSRFTKLRRLEIPHYLLSGDMVKLPFEEAGAMLPATLEELVITHVYDEVSNIWDIVDGISFARYQNGGFTKLRKATLDSEGRPLTENYVGGSLDELEMLGIEVQALLEESDWDSDEYVFGCDGQ